MVCGLRKDSFDMLNVILRFPFWSQNDVFDTTALHINGTRSIRDQGMFLEPDQVKCSGEGCGDL